MAHESFEDEEVAKLLNERFVAVKVDREERPDVDSIYMRVCQLLTGQGGWPLHVFLTPDQKPFYAGTYFPKESRYGRPGFVDVLKHLSETYRDQREKIEEATTQIIGALQENASRSREGELDKSILQETFQQLANQFDAIYGGFGHAPKFPIPHQLMFLMKYYRWTKNEQALYMVKKTLTQMAKGGIWDHIGFGFARYSTDNMWLVPHFEKMLYDNALLLYTFVEAWQITKNPEFKKNSEQIIEFVLREMRDESGAFFSAIDADSEGEEGKYYVWTKKEVVETLGEELGELFCKVYDITEEGNFEGKNIPNLINWNVEKAALNWQMPFEQLEEQLEQARKMLFEKRSERPFPHFDDKILTAWNGLMICALAKAGAAFQKKEYIDIAKKALEFIGNHLIAGDRIMVRYRKGEVKQKGFLDDYAFLLWAYLEMYEATLQLAYLKKAKQLADRMIRLFWDQDNGGFFFTGHDGESLIVREKEIYDGALPAGNSVAAFTLLKLTRLTGDVSYSEKLHQMYSLFSKEVERYGSGHVFFLQSFLTEQMPQKEIVILGPKDCRKKETLLNQFRQAFTPEIFVLVAENPDQFLDIAEFAKSYRMLNNETTIYICENFACRQPTTDFEEVIKTLNI